MFVIVITQYEMTYRRVYVQLLSFAWSSALDESQWLRSDRPSQTVIAALIE